MAVVDTPESTPAFRLPYRHGYVDMFGVYNAEDYHIWANDGQPSMVWQAMGCIFESSPVSGFCLPGSLTEPRSAVQEAQSTAPQFFESAVFCATIGVPEEDLRTLAGNSVKATVHRQVHEDVATLLAAEATAGGSYSSPLSGVAAAVQAAAEMVGDGIGLIHISPLLATHLLSTHLFVTPNGHLEDVFGNVYVVGLAQPAGTIYVENESSYAVYIGRTEYLDLPPDVIAGRNERQVRAFQGFLLQRSSCDVRSITFDTGTV